MWLDQKDEEYFCKNCDAWFDCDAEVDEINDGLDEEYSEEEYSEKYEGHPGHPSEYGDR